MDSEIFLNESAPVGEQYLYHGTKLDVALKILNDNILYGSDSKTYGGGPVGVSTSRSLDFAFNFADGTKHLDGSESGDCYVVLALDRNKLKNNYKIEPYRDEDAFDYFEEDDYLPEFLEKEEVVIGDIHNVKKYLVGIFVSSDVKQLDTKQKLVNYYKQFSNSDIDDESLNLILNAKVYSDRSLYNMRHDINEQINEVLRLAGVKIVEEIVYGEMNDDEMMVILHNPTRKELKDNNLDDECRIIKDGNGGYYFASSEWTHEQIENKLKSKNLPYEETMGEFYYYQDNLFATRDDWNTDKEYYEYKQDWYKTLKSKSYIVKNFGNFNVEIFGNEKLRESIYWKGEKINNFEDISYYDSNNKNYDTDDEMIVWKNPSAEWVKNQLDDDNYFRFVYDSKSDIIYMWYGEMGFHMDTMEITGIDGDIVGTLSNGLISYWGDDNGIEKSNKLFYSKRKDWLDIIEPDGYEIEVQY